MKRREFLTKTVQAAVAWQLLKQGKLKAAIESEVSPPNSGMAAKLPEVAPYEPFELNLRQLRKINSAGPYEISGSQEALRTYKWDQTYTIVKWDPLRTAAVICDMWDRHWSRNAMARVEEMAPRINDVVKELRRRGVLIIHCPSDTMKHYEGAPERKLAQAAPPVEMPIPADAQGTVLDSGWCNLNLTREAPLPIDDSDGGGDDNPPCKPATEPPWPWHQQIASIQIEPGDAVTDSREAFYLMRQRGITNVIIMGVSENMCILGRPFGIRQMIYQGQNVVLIRDLTDSMYNPQRMPYVSHYEANDLVGWHIEKYWCPTITSDQIIGGLQFRFAADANRGLPVFRNYVKLPTTDVHYQRVKPYIEDTPNPDYSQASDEARAALREMKFGVRIHWGVYVKLGYGCNASWPFVRADSGHPGLNNEQRQAYQQFYKSFNPTKFNADEWMELFKSNGIKVVAFTTKHHDGFSMFDTHARVRRRVNWTASGGPEIEECDFAYSIMDSPYRRDIVKEITNAARRHDVKIDLYFSLPDWYDADFRPFADHPLHTRVNKAEQPDQWFHFVMRARQQLTELLTQYGKIDIIDLDQYYDETAWLDLRETMKIIRRIQPDVMFRARGIGNYGDYYTPEGFVPGSKSNTDMPWMVIYPLAGDGIWAYEPDASKYKDGNWIVTNLVDAVAKGGNFMVGIGPDEEGQFHPKAISALQYAGDWLKINGEAIFHTHPLPGDGWKDGDNVRLTHSDLGPIIYAIALQWPGNELVLHKVELTPGATVTMLGSSEALSWRNDSNGGIIISLPTRWQILANRPSELPCVFKLNNANI
ncbi:MAG TPA: alpha-L-fucosidase [Verrucomicrobiae bacterium]|nr:alpha-L-fucosidase [Verrucomicrobiae bacterium]